MPTPPHETPLAFPCCASFPFCPIYLEACKRNEENQEASSADETVLDARYALDEAIATYRLTWEAAEALKTAIHERRTALNPEPTRPIDAVERELRYALDDELLELQRREEEDYERRIALQTVCDAYGPSMSAVRAALRSDTRAQLHDAVEVVEGAGEALFKKHAVLTRMTATHQIRRNRHHERHNALHRPQTEGHLGWGNRADGSVVVEKSVAGVITSNVLGRTGWANGKGKLIDAEQFELQPLIGFVDIDLS